MEEGGHWLDIGEYTQYRGISISTARRYIKAKRVKSKKVEGKYLIFVSNENYDKKSKARFDLASSLESQRLKDELMLLKEENIELRMLISIYENTKNIAKDSFPPNLPSDTK